ncbi:MerR family DNA-binding protein [Spirosoma endophyticum]|uniref:MerR, DNA binding n=1 Tax=Spirosoma endophyticum TaxID=662367 RepID=A0A1I1R3Q6_9BACT|nr:MerR family DNA-binding protein [Spirosoma endophyticum]SFD29024.1 MerR, DNA binding [Spirosoma endophyticum]
MSRLQAIRELKNIGYTLTEIKQITDSCELGELDWVAGKKQISEKVQVTDQQISLLLRVKDQLMEAVANGPYDCKITIILQGIIAAE